MRMIGLVKIFGAWLENAEGGFAILNAFLLGDRIGPVIPDCRQWVQPEVAGPMTSSAASPESIFAELSGRIAEYQPQALGLWIPGPRLRRVPE
jgi:hypothetical protein